jgi:D-3-phosphoglycerate dehydrogenase
MKILISPSSFGQCGDKPIRMLEERGFEVIINPYGRKLTEEETIELGKNCLGIVAGVENYNCKVLGELSSLRVISRVGVGIDAIDLECAKEKEIIIRNTPDGPTRAVAELTLALVMNLLRKVSLSDRRIRNGVWKKEIGNLIQNKVVGIIGLGRIGKAVAEIFKALGAKITAYDLYPDYDWAKAEDVNLVDMNTLLTKSDIITLHLPRTEKPLFTTKEFELMKDSAYLINIARGGVVDEEALFNALNKGLIKGAAVDVFMKEPYDGKLKELDNVILTPHLGSYACESKLQMEIDAVINLLEELNYEGGK